MGDVVSNGRVKPNGQEIFRLRQESGWPQKVLADKAHISVRLLRDIERKSHPIPAATITDIATSLKTTPDKITLVTAGATPDPSSQLKLRAMRSASELSGLASIAEQYQWALKVDPTAATAENMQQVMRIVHRLVYDPRPGLGHRARDEFDEMSFGEIPRLALLQDVLKKLRDDDVGVLAGSYLSPLPGTFEFILRIHFVSANVEEEVFDLERAKRALDMDDEIPF